MSHGPYTHYSQPSPFLGTSSSLPSNSLSSLPSSYASTPSSSGLQLEFFGQPEGTQNGMNDIQDASLAVLLQNAIVRKLFNDWQDATSQVIKLSGTINHLINENQRLQSLSTGITAGVSSTSTAPLLVSGTTSNSNVNSRAATPAVPTIGLSRTIVSVRSTERPSHLPNEVLWNLEDCANDENARPSSHNASRPAMACALRTEAGDMITDAKYSKIKADVAALCGANLHSLPDIDKSKGVKAKGPRTRAWYALWYREDLWMVIEELERVHPILALCSGHWKVEHLISNHLNSSTVTEKRCNNPDHKLNRRKAADARKQRREAQSPHVSSSEAEAQTTQPAPPNDSNPDPNARSSKDPKRPRSNSAQDDPARKRPKAVSGTDSAGILEATFQLGGGSKPKGKEKQREITQPHSPRSTSRPPTPSPRPPPIPPQQANVNVGWIKVDPTAANLKGALSTEFRIANGVELVAALEKLATGSDGDLPTPSADVLTYLERLEKADPNMPGLSEEDDNEAWGHYQYRADGMTPMSVLKDWVAVGHTSIAYRLIAAAIRTSRVARYLVLQRKRKAQQYTSDAYIDIIMTRLWDIVKPVIEKRTEMEKASSNPGKTSSPSDADRLKSLHVKELKQWAQQHNIALPPGNPQKPVIIEKILGSAENIPTESNVVDIIAARAGNKKSG